MAAKQVVPVTQEGKSEEAPRSVAGANVMPQGQFFLDPQSSFQRKWDLFIILLLFFTAAVTPAEVAFLEPKYNGLFVINRFVDVGFIVDMFMQFRLGFVDPETFEIVYDTGRITKNYLTGWFTIDFVSIIPFDLLGLVLQSDDVSQLKVLRTVRLLRLIKLLRVLRSSRVFARIEHSLGLSHVVLSLMKYLLVIIITIHWSTCYYAIVPAMTGNYPTWMDDAGMVDFGPGQTYIKSFEYALLAFVCGYGSASPANSTERGWGICMLLITLFVYAYFIGSICDVVANMDPASTEVHERMDTLNLYLEEMKMAKGTRVRFRRFVSNCEQMHRQKFYISVLDQLSPALRGEFCEFTAGPWIRTVKFFVCENPDEQRRFVVAVAQKLVREAFPQGECIYKHNEFADKLYIVQQGIIGCNGRVLRTGSCVGKDMITCAGRRFDMATALTFADMQTLHKDDLEQVLDLGDFPQTEEKILRAAFKMSLRAYFRDIVNKMRAKKAFASKESMTEQEIEQWKLDNQRALASKKQESKHAALTQTMSYARPSTADAELARNERIKNMLKPQKIRRRHFTEKTLQSQMDNLQKRIAQLKVLVWEQAVPTPEAKVALTEITGSLGTSLGSHDDRLGALEQMAREHTKFLQQVLSKVDPSVISV